MKVPAIAVLVSFAMCSGTVLAQNALYDPANSFVNSQINSGATFNGPIAFGSFTGAGDASGISAYVATTTPTLGSTFDQFRLEPRLVTNVANTASTTASGATQSIQLQFTAQPGATSYQISALFGNTNNVSGAFASLNPYVAISLTDVSANTNQLLCVANGSGLQAANVTMLDTTSPLFSSYPWAGSLIPGNTYRLNVFINAYITVPAGGASGSSGISPVNTAAGLVEPFVQLDIIPTPSTAALLGLGGLVATRRRRA